MYMCIIYRRQCKLIWKGDQCCLDIKKKPLAKLLVAIFKYLNMYKSDINPPQISSLKYFGFQIAMALWGKLFLKAMGRANLCHNNKQLIYCMYVCHVGPLCYYYVHIQQFYCFLLYMQQYQQLSHFICCSSYPYSQLTKYMQLTTYLNTITYVNVINIQ